RGSGIRIFFLWRNLYYSDLFFYSEIKPNLGKRTHPLKKEGVPWAKEGGVKKNQLYERDRFERFEPVTADVVEIPMAAKDPVQFGLSNSRERCLKRL
ncbi:hypothetical protein SUGI_0607430, partial [Cryptomeria japonica]